MDAGRRQLFSSLCVVKEESLCRFTPASVAFLWRERGEKYLFHFGQDGKKKKTRLQSQTGRFVRRVPVNTEREGGRESDQELPLLHTDGITTLTAACAASTQTTEFLKFIFLLRNSVFPPSTHPSIHPPLCRHAGYETSRCEHSPALSRFIDGRLSSVHVREGRAEEMCSK